MEKDKIIYYLNEQLKRVLPNSPQMVALQEAIDIVKKEKEKDDLSNK